MLELNLDPIEQMKYYECGDFPFNFYLTNIDAPASALSTEKFILDWMNNMPEGKVANWVVKQIKAVELRPLAIISLSRREVTILGGWRAG